MKRLLILGVILLAACNKIDFEDGDINPKVLQQHEFWRMGPGCGLEIYDADGNYKTSANINGGFYMETEIYDYLQIKDSEIRRFWYIHNWETDTYRKIQLTTSPADFSKRGKYIGREFMVRKFDDIIEGKVTKMTDEEIIIYIDITDKERHRPGEYLYLKIVLQRAEPEKEFLELFADELN